MQENIDQFCNKWRSYISTTEKNAEVQKLSLHIVDIFEKAMKTRKLLPDELNEIIKAMAGKKMRPFYVGSELLISLFPEFPDVEIQWRKLANSPIAHERWVAITMLNDLRIPDEFAFELIKSALDDKSPKVRKFAVDRIYPRRFVSLISDLEERMKLEQNEKVRQSIQWMLNVLNDPTAHPLPPLGHLPSPREEIIL